MRMSQKDLYTLNTDGGSRGNPGPAAAGLVIKDKNNELIKSLGEYLGICTNNDAEYRAVILGLETAKSLGIKNIICVMDSELVVKQLNGEYRIKIQRLKDFVLKVRKLEKNFESVTYTHVLRDENTEADLIVNSVLDSRS